MSQKPKSQGIFEGTDEIVSSFLGLTGGEKLNQKSTCQRLASAPNGPLDFEALISDLYARIEHNWSHRDRQSPPSLQNWRSEPQTTLDKDNRSPEVLLERAVAILGSRDILPGWFNQVPVASGLVDSHADGRAAIDLVQRQGDRAEFIELKWNSDTPAFAAFEILRYGLVFLFSSVNREALGYSEKGLLDARDVMLRVLARHAYYDEFDLTWLGHGLDGGIRAFAERMTNGKLSMGFGFLAFSAEFRRPFMEEADVLRLREGPADTEEIRSLMSAIRNIVPVWQSRGFEAA